MRVVEAGHLEGLRHLAGRAPARVNRGVSRSLESSDQRLSHGTVNNKHTVYRLYTGPSVGSPGHVVLRRAEATLRIA